MTRRAFADGRVRTFSFALFFLLYAYVQPVGFRHSFPTLHDRLVFAKSFGDNKAIRLFYGVPHDLLTTGGYSAWRVGGSVAIFASAWGMLAAVRAMRAEEESGRTELVLAAPVSRARLYRSALVAIALGAVLLWAAVWLGSIAGGLPAGGAAYMALACIAPALVFAGVGALASQLAATRRLAIELAGGVLTLAFLLRVVADTTSGLSWLRWLTPLGWSEEMRAFADPRPAPLLLFAAATAFLVVMAGRMARTRDVGAALLAPADESEPDYRLLSSPTAYAFRAERVSLAIWATGLGVFALVVGVLAHTLSTVKLPSNLQQEFSKVGGASITTVSGALGLYFLFFVFALCLFACAQLASVRREEADERLETLLALPVERGGWLRGRLALGGGGAAALALLTGLCAWLGAALAGGGVSIGQMLGAGANCIPAVLLFLGVGALVFGVAPRAVVGVSYGLVSVAFIWELVGALLGAPTWTLALSPFHNVALVPAQPFKAGAAAVMVAIALVAGALAVYAFRRRDLAGT